jgi:hypothetical protein
MNLIHEECLTKGGYVMILKYFFAWFGMMILAIINGGLRDFVYKAHVGDLPAHQISTVILVLLLAGYFRILTGIWPIKSASQACVIGGIWFLMTEAFEFGMGIFIEGASWSKLFYAYNVFAGQVWIFIPLWVLAGPYLFYRHSIKQAAARPAAVTDARKAPGRR